MYHLPSFLSTPWQLLSTANPFLFFFLSENRQQPTMTQQDAIREKALRFRLDKATLQKEKSKQKSQRDRKITTRTVKTTTTPTS